MITVIIFFIIIAALSAIGIVFSFVNKNACNTPTPETYIFAVIAFLSTVSAVVCETTPTSMDVYKGKTTLEYTVRDGVRTDSVVVYKAKK